MRKMIVILAVHLMIAPSISEAQLNFSLDDSVKTAVFPSLEHVFYTWFVITNHTGQDLNLRWVRTYDEPYPTAWSNNVVVLNNNYPATTDSADFILPAVAGPSDYILVFNYPNNTVDSAYIRITVYDPANPADRVSGLFEYFTYQFVGLEDHDLSKASQVFPNPSPRGKFNLSEDAARCFDELMVFDPSGNFVKSVSLRNETKIDLSNNGNGFYVLRFIDHTNKRMTERKVIVGQ